MNQREPTDAADMEWSRQIAVLAVDGLYMAKMITRDQLKRAVDIVAEEIFVRLTMNDRPAPWGKVS